MTQLVTKVETMHSCVTYRVLRTLVAVGGAAALLGGCGDGDQPPTMPGSAPPSLSQSAVSVTAGAPSVLTTLNVTSTDVVTLSARTADGIFVVFSPAVLPAGSQTSAVSIAASGGVAAGTYPVTILASRAAGATDSVTLTLTVTAAPLTGTAVTLRYCAEDAPILLAVREGNGFWTRVTPNSGTSTYQFRVAASLNLVGIASVDTVGMGYHLRVIYARDFEMAGISDALGLGECAAGAASGTVVNAGTPANATVALAHSWVSVNTPSSGPFSLSGVGPAPHDLIASRIDPMTSLPNKLLLRRGLSVGTIGTLAPIDFDAPEAFVPVQGTVALTGLGSDSVVVATAFLGTGGRANGQIGRSAAFASTVSTLPFTAIPAARLESGELQQLTVTAPGAGSTTSSRSATVFFRTAPPSSVTLGSALATPLVTRIGGPSARVRVTFGAESQYSRFVTASFAQASESRFASVLVTPSMGLAPWDFSIPDLIDVAGWNNNWGLSNSAPIAWSVTAAGGPSFRLGTNVSDGGVLRSATRSGVLPAP